jgi:hypothetical protein
MKRNRNIFLVIILLFVSGLVALAANNDWLGSGGNNDDDLPDAKAELMQLYATYSRPDSSFAMKGVIRLHDNENENLLKEETPFQYIKIQSQYYCRLGYMQTFCADSLLVQLDTLNRQIVVAKFDPAVLAGLTGSLLPFEKFMKQKADFKFDVSIAGGKKQRTLTVRNDLAPEIKRASVSYDPDTYRIISSEIEWWKDALAGSGESDQNKTWVTRIEYEHGAAAGEPIVTRINKIFTVKNGKIEPAPVYMGYEFQTTF